MSGVPPRNDPEDRVDWKAWTQVVLAVCLPLVAVVAWAVNSLAAKANVDDLVRTRAQVDAVQLELAGVRSDSRTSAARIETDVAWMKAAIWALVQRTGAPAVPPPPNP